MRRVGRLAGKRRAAPSRPLSAPSALMARSAGSPTMLEFLQALPRRLLIALVKGYRLLLSPWLGSSCRFVPTCSAYSLDALQQHGAGMGSYLTLRRLVRCHPFCAGGHDPVPELRPRILPLLPNPPLAHRRRMRPASTPPPPSSVEKNLS